MKRFAAKLAFIHRTLWRREQIYRWAAVLGPPPLLGCAVAVVAWTGVQQVAIHETSSTTGSDVPWAHWNRPVPREGQPFAEAPSAPLPSGDARGGYVGFQTGWIGAIQPISVDATQDVNVVASVQGRFTLDQATIPLERIADAASPNGLFVGTERSYFVIKSAGLYAFSARLTRAGTQSANCLVRFASSHHQMLRNVVLNSAGDAVLNFAPTEFRLEPGLFLLQTAVGCWRGDHMVGTGEMALMVRRPGETVLTPATAGEVMRPMPKNVAGPR